MKERDLFRFFAEQFPKSGTHVKLWSGEDGALIERELVVDPDNDTRGDESGEPSAADKAGICRAKSVAVSDMLLEDVHFARELCSWADIGYKAVSANLSDIAACGAEPAWLTLALAAPGEEALLTALYSGFREALGTWGVDFAGGDYVYSERVCISLSLTGYLVHDFWSRKQARPDDYIYVSGIPGASALGLALLQNGDREQFGGSHSLSPGQASFYRRQFCRPEPPLAQSRWLRSHTIPVHACIDISDGLSSELYHIAGESDCSLLVDSSRIPRPEHPRGLEFALGGGEDFELLFTSPVEIDSELFQKETGFALTCIGRVGRAEQASGVFDVTEGGSQKLPLHGYEHGSGA